MTLTEQVALITFILPGLSNSGPEHWQSYWERMDSQCQRILQDEWEDPRCEDWVATLGRAVASAQSDIVFVAHSSACALVAHWAAIATSELAARVRGALLVGPSDPEGPNYPDGPSGFAPMPRFALPFPSVVVASEDDAYVSLEQARSYAEAWGSVFVNVGAAGHVNGASNLGAWPMGYALLERLREGGHRDRVV
ncbi:MAG: alpha/beta hydrolase [bacterium]